jgi:hypothetical protein
MGTTVEQVRSIDKRVKKIVSRICKQMDAEINNCREYWKITSAITFDPEMLELMEDPANQLAPITAYLNDLVWDVGTHTGDWLDTINDGEDAEEASASAEAMKSS